MYEFTYEGADKRTYQDCHNGTHQKARENSNRRTYRPSLGPPGGFGQHCGNEEIQHLNYDGNDAQNQYGHPCY